MARIRPRHHHAERKLGDRYQYLLSTRLRQQSHSTIRLPANLAVSAASQAHHVAVDEPSNGNGISTQCLDDKV